MMSYALTPGHTVFSSKKKVVSFSFPLPLVVPFTHTLQLDEDDLFSGVL